jgi:hypothetical protein
LYLTSDFGLELRDCCCCSMCACLNNCVALNLRVSLISIVSERERERETKKNNSLSLSLVAPWPWDYVFIVSPPPVFLFSITKFNQPDIVKHWHNFFKETNWFTYIICWPLFKRERELSRINYRSLDKTNVLVYMITFRVRQKISCQKWHFIDQLSKKKERTYRTIRYDIEKTNHFYF